MDIEEMERVAKAAGSTLDPEDLRQLLEHLVELGATEEELRRAIEVLNVGELALDLAVRSGPTHPLDEAAEAAGLTADEAARMWRAFGFPDPSSTSTQFPDDAVAALQLLASSREFLGEDATLALARVVGTSTSRIAQAVLDTFRVQLEAPQIAAGGSYSKVVRNYTDLARDVLPKFIDAIGAVVLRHLVAVAASDWTPGADGGASEQDLAVGFADITGYTALSLSLSPRDLTRIVSEFEEAVGEATSRHGGRVVKLIGDGAMFSADDASRACRIGTGIVASANASSVLPPVRVGIASGRVVNLGGDLFGPVVNLAARLVAVTLDNTVAVDEETAARARGSFAFEPMAPHELKGIPVPVSTFRVQV